MDTGDYYPSWLSAALLDENTLPWADASVVSMSAFLDSYTLHDSYWINLLLHPDQSGIAVIRFDSFWAKDRVPYPGDAVAEWPILLLRFEPLYHVVMNSSSEGGTIAAAASALLSEEYRERLLECISVFGTAGHDAADAPLDPTLCRTTIEDIYGGRVVLFHGRDVRLLCLNRQGEVQPLLGLT